MRDPAEDIIAQALMSGDHERGMREMTCNVAARTKIHCQCGRVLDQENCIVVEREDTGAVVMVYCPMCWQQAKSLWKEKYSTVSWKNEHPQP